jgi:hypothetical protein
VVTVAEGLKGAVDEAAALAARVDGPDGLIRYRIFVSSRQLPAWN